MRKLVLFIVSAFVFSVSSVAQTKAVKVAKISTPTVQCDMCKNRIEQYIKRIDGITMANVAVKKKEVTVKYLTDRTNEEIIKAAIANAGYDAAEIAANPDSYKMLPKCCKKPDEPEGKTKN